MELFDAYCIFYFIINYEKFKLCEEVQLLKLNSREDAIIELKVLMLCLKRKFDFLLCCGVEDKIRITNVSLIQDEKGTKFSYYKSLNLTFPSAFIPFTFSFVLVTNQHRGDRSWLTDRLCLFFNGPHFHCCENLLSGRTCLHFFE
ncbi:hypothetical protein T01_5156 [Trichinella spiralis]|uniref:Uncharacterized protein n=1 Tax=Trichinella spiralis TaxID=6334 RepID=A0A0V1AYC8_TRISP|nr:hypothetical protein T01_5156 [Trichinella spiralis]